MSNSLSCQDKLSEAVIPRSCIHANCNMDMPRFAVTSRRAASILLRVRSKACCCLLRILAWHPPCSFGMACFAAAMRVSSICRLSRSASPFPGSSQSKFCLASARKGSSIWWLIPCHCCFRHISEIGGWRDRLRDFCLFLSMTRSRYLG